MAAKQTRVLAPADNEKGMATIETIPLLFLFVFLFAYTMGGFGIVHTAIKNSIAARTYAFETFRNRTNLVYFRDLPGADLLQFANRGTRTHGIASEDQQGESAWIVTERPLRVGYPSSAADIRNARAGNALDIHNNQIFSGSIAPGKRINSKLEVNPVWLMIEYGMCLNVRCGG